jgi:tetratricopeptide (TPR) repeat protein
MGADEERGLVRFGALAVVGAAVLIGAVVLACLRAPGRRIRVFGLCWFLIGFLPISNLIPLNATVAEHWIYMPSIGALVFLAGCAFALPRRWMPMVGYAVLVAVGALGVRTALKVRDWTSNERLFTQTIEATGGSARIHMNLAVLHLQRGEIEIAEEQLRGALKRFPDAEPIRIKLGSVLRRRGRTAEAEALLDDSASFADEIAKRHVATWNESLTLARMRHGAGRSDEALEILAGASKRFPHVWDVCALRARVLAEAEGPAAAASVVEDYVDAHWWSYPGHLLLGRLRFALNDPRGAIGAFDHAASLDIHAGEPFVAIGEVQAACGNPVAARAALDEAIRRDPQSAARVQK